MAGIVQAKRMSRHVLGHDPLELLNAGVPGGDAGVSGPAHDLQISVSTDVEVVREAGRVIDAEDDRLARRHVDALDLLAVLQEADGSVRFELDDARLPIGGRRGRPLGSIVAAGSPAWWTQPARRTRRARWTQRARRIWPVQRTRRARWSADDESPFSRSSAGENVHWLPESLAHAASTNARATRATRTLGREVFMPGC